MTSPKTLADLVPGQKAHIGSLLCEGGLRARLQDIGLVPGTQVECLHLSPLGDPTAFLIRGAVIALRQVDASLILLDFEENIDADHGQSTRSHHRAGRQS